MPRRGLTPSHAVAFKVGENRWESKREVPQKHRPRAMTRRLRSKSTRAVGYVHLKALVSADGQEAVVEDISEKGVVGGGIRQAHDVLYRPRGDGIGLPERVHPNCGSTMRSR